MKIQHPAGRIPTQMCGADQRLGERTRGYSERRKSNPRRSKEYASYIMEAIVTGNPYKIGGNVLNTGLIDNLPSDACVEVPCMVDANGISPCHVGRLPAGSHEYDQYQRPAPDHRSRSHQIQKKDLSGRHARTPYRSRTEYR